MRVESITLRNVRVVTLSVAQQLDLMTLLALEMYRVGVHILHGPPPPLPPTATAEEGFAVLVANFIGSIVEKGYFNEQPIRH